MGGVHGFLKLLRRMLESFLYLENGIMTLKKADEVLDYSVCTKQSKDIQFASEEKRKRYEYLKVKLTEALKA